MTTLIAQDMMHKIRRIEIRTRHLVEDLFAGSYLSVFKGRGIEFDEVRPYQPGDDVRAIDWNVTARTGELYVKRFVEERELTLMLVVDASASQDFGTRGRFKREAAVEVAATLAFAAVANNDKVGLLVFTDRVELLIPPRKGRKHVLRLIRDVLTFEPKGHATDVKLALDRVNQVMKRRGIVLLISDFLDDPESYRKALAIAGSRHDLIAIDLHDPLESRIDAIGLMMLEDAETGDLVEVDTTDRAWRAAFRAHLQQIEAAKQRAFSAAKVDRVLLATPDDTASALARFFQGRMRRMATRHGLRTRIHGE